MAPLAAGVAGAVAAGAGGGGGRGVLPVAITRQAPQPRVPTRLAWRRAGRGSNRNERARGPVASRGGWRWRLWLSAAAVVEAAVLPMPPRPASSSIQAPASIGGGGPMTVSSRPNSPEKGSVGWEALTRPDVDGRWVAGRRLNGDETRNNTSWPGMGSFGIYRFSVFQRQ